MEIKVGDAVWVNGSKIPTMVVLEIDNSQWAKCAYYSPVTGKFEYVQIPIQGLVKHG
jgi:hypothetical protein